MGSAAAAGTMACRAHAGRVACTRAYVIAAYRQLARRQARSYACGRSAPTADTAARACAIPSDIPSPVSASTYPPASPTRSTLPATRLATRCRSGPAPRTRVAAEASASLSRSCGNSLSCSSNGTRRGLSTATPTRSVPTGVMYASRLAARVGHGCSRAVTRSGDADRSGLWSAGAHIQTKRATCRRMQPISCQKIAAIDVRSRGPAESLRSDAHLAGRLNHLACRQGQDFHASGCCDRPQRRVELRTADASAPPNAEVSLCLLLAADIADANQIPSNRVDPKGGQGMHAARHETFTARLVDRALSGLEYDN